MRRTGRRLTSIVAVVVLLPLVILALPLLIIAGVVADVLARRFRFPAVRLGLYLLVYLIHEWIAIGAAVVLFLARALGLFRFLPRRGLGAYRGMQAWWAASLLRWAGRLLGVRFDLDDLDDLPDEGFILLSRHASMADAVLPAVLVADRLGRYVHYVLKQELQRVPSLDLYGHRLGNYFVSRHGDGDAEARAIAEFAAAAQPDSALVIFPEGTYSTPARQRSVRASLERRGLTELVALADDLDHLLPPKPAGTLALLEAQPDLDVVIMGHVGLEGVTDAGLLRRLPLRRPVVVRWWVHPRSEVPDDPEDQVAWLNQQWRSLDRWVASVAAERP